MARGRISFLNSQCSSIVALNTILFVAMTKILHKCHLRKFLWFRFEGTIDCGRDLTTAGTQCRDLMVAGTQCRDLTVPGTQCSESHCLCNQEAEMMKAGTQLAFPSHMV